MSPLPASLFQHWLHSREEDAEGVNVYRPMSYPFPPARGRPGFEFRANGEFFVYEIAAADGWQPLPGHWEAKTVNLVPDYLRRPKTGSPPLADRVV